VEVLRRYSNRTDDLLGSMIEVLRRIEEGDRTDEAGVCKSGSGRTPVRERLGQDGIDELVECRQSGVRLQDLVERYGISLSRVKRILRIIGA
jgi:hypothetical protein